MSRKINLIIFLCFILCEVYAQYVPDVLGDGYLRRTFQMPDDYEGKVVCTLVKKPQLDSVKQAVLYIHGYNDYFFQKQLGDSVNAHGYNFYAMDLRKYGRSILPNQNPFFCKSLKEYFADIDTALATIRSEGNERILLMAHSTGGLITPYYLNSKKGELPVDGLILNSLFWIGISDGSWRKSYCQPLRLSGGYSRILPYKVWVTRITLIACLSNIKENGSLTRTGK